MPSERFWSKVDKSGDCWIWTACRKSSGADYGLFYFDGRTQTTHRVVWQLTYGPIADGLVVRHRCDNPPCVRPDHLDLGSNAMNVMDRLERGRDARGSLHGQSVLTEEAVADIRRCADGAPRGTQSALARQYGVSEATISRIVLHHGWLHV
jgi:hypothetical protein